MTIPIHTRLSLPYWSELDSIKLTLLINSYCDLPNLPISLDVRTSISITTPRARRAWQEGLSVRGGPQNYDSGAGSSPNPCQEVPTMALPWSSILSCSFEACGTTEDQLRSFRSIAGVINWPSVSIPSRCTLQILRFASNQQWLQCYRTRGMVQSTSILLGQPVTSVQ